MPLPHVKPPTRVGFGSTVIERSLRHDLRGDSKLEFLLHGVRARFTIPASFVRLAPGGAATGAESAAPSSPGGAVPQDVLLVEDNLIIALDTEEVMQRLGVATVRVASGVADALKTIDERKPAFALLDVNLGVETSYEIAERLMALKVPFAFATGYGEQIAFPPEFAAVPKIRKPYSTETLRTTLQDAKPS